jgi:hypothetical protein
MKYKLILFTVLFAACNNSGNKSDQKTTDSTAVGNSAIVASTFDNKLFKPISLPFNLDTTFILKADTNDRIPYQQIRSLGYEFLKNELTDGLINNIQEFCKIDSLKQAGAYKSYIDSLTIGMTKISIAYKIGVIDFKNNSRLFIWGITNSSYEACPFYSGTYLAGTFVNEAKQNTHFILGEISGGGDPPSMGSNEITAKVNGDGKIEIMNKRVFDDLDVPGEETTKQILSLKLDKDKIQIMDFKKEVKNTEKIQE